MLCILKSIVLLRWFFYVTATHVLGEKNGDNLEKNPSILSLVLDVCYLLRGSKTVISLTRFLLAMTFVV